METAAAGRPALIQTGHQREEERKVDVSVT